MLPEQKPKPQPFDFVKIVLAIVLGLAAIYSEVSAVVCTAKPLAQTWQVLSNAADDSKHDDTLWDAIVDSFPVLVAIGSYLVKLFFQYEYVAHGCLSCLMPPECSRSTTRS